MDGGATLKHDYRVLLPNLLTFSRVPIGVAVLWCCLQGLSRLALDLYLLGLATDLADGLLARGFAATSEFGKRWDRRADMFFNTLAGVGIAWLTLARGEAWGLAGLAGVVFGLPLSLIWVPADSAASKLRSGLIRAVFVALLLAELTQHRHVRLLAVGLLLGGGGLYELAVMRREARR